MSSVREESVSELLIIFFCNFGLDKTKILGEKQP